MTRRIIHLNIANFGAAVEQLCDPSLARRPLILAAQHCRSLVVDMNEIAYQAGVRRYMPLTQARRRCPEALVRPPRPGLYQRAMARCHSRARRCSPLVEQGPGLGHFYLDVSGSRRLLGPPRDVGRQLYRILYRETGLQPTWSLATSKVVAKVASRLAKPRGAYLVEAGQEAAFLAPLPLRLLPGIDHTLERRFRELNLRRIGQLAALSPGDLELFGSPAQGQRLWHLVRGIDPEPLCPRPTGRAAGLQLDRWLVPDSNHGPALHRCLRQLVSDAGLQLRQQGLGCRCLTVTLEYSDGVQASRQARSRTVAASHGALMALAEDALVRAWKRRVRVRRLSLDCRQLVPPARQLSLFDHNTSQRDQCLDAAMDTIHRRYGTKALVFASTLLH